MDKIKTLLGILAIGFLIYLYMNYFPVIAKKIQQALLGSNTYTEEVKPAPVKTKKMEAMGEKKKKRDMFEPIDEKDYERKAEEEIDRLLNLQ
ncbi:MAG: hypothetical protein D6831_02435 [Aquificota bacterium]|nr:MAG: hypothetical protein D6831_02435 [Aquificota bacterium]